MKAKMVLPTVAVCLCLLFAPIASAETQAINFTIYFDWNRDFIFSSTSLSIDPATMTFTTGDGGYGDAEILGGCLALIFRGGACPLYSGPFYGFMDRRIGDCTYDPGYWYLGPATGVGSLKPGDRKSDGS